ncbi:hypothetical protein EJV47_13875 [Hymenobacter gummosus]|uniref:Uncharacterized protein n=1 Tax=Hymenobacter gummosus TaxID=1776032 RepID=A0A3S0H5Y8_9BACT|nr:hypothetical protein [Hymenobacter gummosus]RTQ49230.1 hypothetical protein EJV47_13875 [Hymenobacter gummosus]
MNKALLAAALLLTVLACWAFYPKPVDETGYMTVTLYINGSSRGDLVVTAPDGTVTAQDLGRQKSLTQMRGLLLVKVNELRRQGWQVVQMAPNRIIGTFASGTDTYYEDVYLLEKR